MFKNNSMPITRAKAATANRPFHDNPQRPLRFSIPQHLQVTRAPCSSGSRFGGSESSLELSGLGGPARLWRCHSFGKRNAGTNRPGAKENFRARIV